MCVKRFMLRKKNFGENDSHIFMKNLDLFLRHQDVF